MEPRYNKRLYNKVLGITNDFLSPKEPPDGEHILQIRWPFVIGSTEIQFAFSVLQMKLRILSSVHHIGFGGFTVYKPGKSIGKDLRNFAVLYSRKRRVKSVAIFVFDFIYVVISTSVLYDMNLNFLSTNSRFPILLKR